MAGGPWRRKRGGTGGGCGVQTLPVVAAAYRSMAVGVLGNVTEVLKEQRAMADGGVRSSPLNAVGLGLVSPVTVQLCSVTSLF